MKISKKYTLTALAFASALTLAGSASAFDGWHVENATTIPGKGSGWDYVALDQQHHHLFIGHRKEGLQVFDTTTNKVVKVIEGTAAAGSNGALLMPEFDLGISNNQDGTVTPFKLSTLEAKPPIKLGTDLDTSHYDSATKRIVVNMGGEVGGTDLIVLQAPELNIVGKIRVPAKSPEHAEADGKGNFYLTARDIDTVFRLDTSTLKITASWKTPGCGQTTGLTLDAAHDRIFLGCRGRGETPPTFVVMNATTGAVIYKSEIGGGNDEVVYDPDLKRVFLSNGINAVLNVFEQVDVDNYKPVDAMGTRAGVRTMAMDAKTKKIYAVVSEGSADYTKKVLTAVSPYYANTFFDNKFTVLTITKD